MSKRARIKTRKSNACKIFGFPKDFDGNTLPTYGDVIRCYLKTQQDLTEGKEGVFLSVKDFYKEVALKLMKIWEKASIPTISFNRIFLKLLDFHSKYRKISKLLSSGRVSRKAKVKIDSFKCKSQKTLFDLSSCKCKSFSECDCVKSRKVPKSEQIFLSDQRLERKMYIGGIDLKMTQEKKRKEQRKEKREKRKKM